ncbi:MAG: hypothetical protein RL885_11865 [Planctomycetota bacterium]
MLTLIGFGLLSWLVSFPAQEVPWDSEPSLNYHLTLPDGRKVPVQIGEPVELPTPQDSTTVTLSVDSHRTFDRAGVRFRYPAAFRWEAERELPVTTYTMEGVEVLLLVQVYPESSEPESFRDVWIDAVTAQYAEQGGETERESIRWKLGKRMRSATRLTTKLGDLTILADVVTLEGADSSILLVFQDILEEGESFSAEGQETRKFLESTFEQAEQ